MNTIIQDFTTNLTASLNAIAESKIYTDIDAMYNDGRLQKDQLDKVIIAFHEKALTMAGSTSENIALKGYRIDDIIAKDLDVKTAQITESAGNLAIKQAQSTKDLDVKTAQITESAGNLAIKQAQSTKDLDVKTAQITTESKRASLIERQELGFSDNVVIERVKTTSEAIGMIQSGGNAAPQTFFNEWTDAIDDIKEIAKTHPYIIT